MQTLRPYYDELDAKLKQTEMKLCAAFDKRHSKIVQQRADLVRTHYAPYQKRAATSLLRRARSAKLRIAKKYRFRPRSFFSTPTLPQLSHVIGLIVGLVWQCVVSSLCGTNGQYDRTAD